MESATSALRKDPKESSFEMLEEGPASPVGGTGLMVASSPLSLLGDSTPSTTEFRRNLATFDFSVAANESRPRQEAAQVRAVGPSEVKGTVLTAEEDSVLCELELPAGPYRIRLSGALFPEGTKYGSPITLRLIEDEGIRKPQIELREPQADRQYEERMAALVAALERE